MVKSPDMRCLACGGRDFVDQVVLWDDLATAWELSGPERAYIDRQQGTHCTACGSNLRSGALAGALLAALGGSGSLTDLVADETARRIDLLEINQAGSLSPFLSRLPGHRLAIYPDVDMQKMPYANGTFDAVVHSDTLEHVPDPMLALSECFRILRPSGVLCFTVPIIVGRLTRDCAGRSPSFHGSEMSASADFQVQTEFGADAWTFVMQAGFSTVTISTIEFPAALAVTAWKGQPAPLITNDSAAMQALQVELEVMRSSRLWRVTHGLRATMAMLRRLVTK
jgi:SAM-dependent methyltransferase